MSLSKRWLPLLSLALLVVLAWWLVDERPEREPALGPERRAPAETDYYAENFTLLSSDADGRWRYRLEAERMLHFPRSEHWEFEAPRLQFYTEQGANWYGVGERGRAWAEGDEVLLQGEVRLWRPASEANQPVQLDTSEVYLRPQEQYAETEQHAILRQPGGLMEGIGARAWLGEERIELLSRVRAHYERQER